MAAVTAPPASAEPLPPPPLDTSGPAADEPEPEEPAIAIPAQPPPANYRADLFDEPPPETQANRPAPSPPADQTDTTGGARSSSAPHIAPPATLPAGSGTLDSATTQRIIDRLVELHFLNSAADAQNPDAVVLAIRDFQASIGISPSGTMDRDTVGRLTLP